MGMVANMWSANKDMSPLCGWINEQNNTFSLLMRIKG